MEKFGQDRGRTFAYATVEAALGAAFGADEKTILSIRGRLKGFQRDGFAPASPGRGKVIRYKIGDIYDWGLALSLAEFGLSPRIVVKAIKPGIFEQNFLPKMDADEMHERGFHLLMVYFPSLFYDDLPASEDPMPFTTEWDYRWEPNAIVFAKTHGRYGLIDLTHLKNRIDAALVA